MAICKTDPVEVLKKAAGNRSVIGFLDWGTGPAKWLPEF